MLVKVARKGERPLTAEDRVDGDEIKAKAKAKFEDVKGKAKSFASKAKEYVKGNPLKVGAVAAGLAAAGAAARHFSNKKKDK